MSERVAVSASRSPALALPHDRLGGDDDAVWFAVADAQLLAMRTIDRAVSPIYWSRADHDAAMADLDGAERSEAIAYRRAHFEPLAAALRFALDRRHGALAAAARAGRRDAFDRAIALLARWSGKRRFERAQPAFLLTRLVERETRLAHELAAASHDELAAAAADHAHRLAEALARHGSPEYARALPYIGLERGVRIAPGADLAAQLEEHREPYTIAGDALFAPWALDDLAALRGDGRTVTVLYGGRAALLHAFDGTAAQRRRELAARTALVAHAPLAPLDEHLLGLRIEQVLFKRWTAAATAAVDPALARELMAQLAGDESGLYLALAAQASGSDPAAELCRLDAVLRDDLVLFSALARDGRHDVLVADLTELAAQVAAEEHR